MGVITKIYNNDDLDDAATKVYPNISDGSLYGLRWKPLTGNTFTGGGSASIVGYHGKDRASQLCISYQNHPLWVRAKRNGVWNDWDSVVLNSDLKRFAYNVTFDSKSRDDAVKEMFYSLPNDGCVHVGILGHGNAISCIVQKYGSDQYGSVLMFGYGQSLVQYTITGSNWRKFAINSSEIVLT